MATLQEHVYAIQNIINRGPKTDDARVSDRLVEHFLKVSRSRLLRQKIDKGHNISELNYATICFPLQSEEYDDCDCLPDDVSCQVLKSTCKIPRYLVGSRVNNLIVEFINGTIVPRGNVTLGNLAQYSISGSFSEPFWTIQNQRLLIFNNDRLPLVLVRAIWEDPSDIVNFCDCTNLDEDVPCYDPREDEFPIDPDLVDPMYRLTMEMLGLLNQYPEDTLNNAANVRNTESQRQS